MGTGLKLRNEEYTTLGDFIKASFERDQPKIMERFPKLNAVFFTDYTTLLEEVKVLESSLVLTEDEKANTKALYAEATLLNKELNFLSNYIDEAGLNTKFVTELKKDLSSSDIEGAVLKIESVKQYVTAHQTALVDEGMSAGFAAALEGHKTSLAAKNAAQNAKINSRKTITDNNKDKYDSLYNYIAKIVKAGKLVFDGTVTEDEYNITRAIKKMRAYKKNAGENPTS
jgi:hypothetical protein